MYQSGIIGFSLRHAEWATTLKGRGMTSPRRREVRLMTLPGFPSSSSDKGPRIHKNQSVMGARDRPEHDCRKRSWFVSSLASPQRGEVMVLSLPVTPDARHVVLCGRESVGICRLHTHGAQRPPPALPLPRNVRSGERDGVRGHGQHQQRRGISPRRFGGRCPVHGKNGMAGARSVPGARWEDGRWHGQTPARVLVPFK